MPIYWFTDDGTKVGYLSSYTGEMGDVALGEEFVLGAEHVALLEGFGAHENASRAKGWLGFHRDLRGTLASMSADLAEMAQDVEDSARGKNAAPLSKAVEGVVRAMGNEWRALMTDLASHTRFEDGFLFHHMAGVDGARFEEAGGPRLREQHAELEALERDTERALSVAAPPRHGGDAASTSTQQPADDDDDTPRPPHPGAAVMRTLASACRAFAAALWRHLELEERCVCPIWLDLTGEQHVEYQDALQRHRQTSRADRVLAMMSEAEQRQGSLPF